jgi:hypothetical protein
VLADAHENGAILRLGLADVRGWRVVGGRRRRGHRFARRGWLIGGVIALSLATVTVGAPAGYAAPHGATTKAPAAGDYTQQIVLYFHPPDPKSPTYWDLFSGPNWGDCAGTAPPQKSGSSTGAYFEETWSFRVVNWSDPNCIVNPTDAWFHVSAVGPAPGYIGAGFSCHFHRGSGATPNLYCAELRLSSGTSRVVVNGYDQVNMFWSADAHEYHDDNVAKAS